MPGTRPPNKLTKTKHKISLQRRDVILEDPQEYAKEKKTKRTRGKAPREKQNKTKQKDNHTLIASRGGG